MTIEASEHESVVQLPITNFVEAVTARRRGMDIALSLGFPLPEATKIAVVISELGRNIVLYAKEGTITVIGGTGNRTYIKIVALDEGPGIPDVELCMTEGYTTSGGLGLGLPGAKRLMDEFEIWSEVGVGTRITAIKWLK